MMYVEWNRVRIDRYALTIVKSPNCISEPISGMERCTGLAEMPDSA